jgi:hypothetical protein
MSYRQQQELQEYEEWLASLEQALRSDDEKTVRETAKQLQGYLDERVSKTV